MRQTHIPKVSYIPNMKFLFLILGTAMMSSAQAAPMIGSRALQMEAGAQISNFSTQGQFSSSGRLFASASYFSNTNDPYSWSNRTFRAWDVRSGVPVAHWKLLTLESFALSPDGQTVAVITSTRYRHDPADICGVEIRDMRSGKLKRTLIRAGTIRANVYSLAWSRDSRLLATGSGDGLARVWNVAKGRRVTKLPVKGSVGAIAFSPDTQLLATVGYSGTQLWDFTRKKLLSGTRFQEYSHYATLEFSPNGNRLAVGDLFDGKTILYHVPTLKSLGSLPAPLVDQINAGFVPPVAFSDDAKRIAFVNGTNLDVRRGTSPRTIVRYKILQSRAGYINRDYVTTIQFTPDNRLMWATLRSTMDGTSNFVWTSPKIWFAPS